MGRGFIIIGLGLIVLPFAVMGLEVLLAIATGATGEARMAAGQLGVIIGFITVIPGFIIFIIGFITWFLSE